jgi:hypothetical protein
VSDQRPAIVRCKADRLTPDVSEARFGAAADGSGVQEQRLVGNFPQAFSHVPLIDTARTLTSAHSKSSTDARAKEGLKNAKH